MVTIKWIFTNQHHETGPMLVVIAAVCKVIQLQYEAHQKFSGGSVVSFHLKLDVSEWRIFSGCSDDAVCSPLHGVYSILCSSCIPVHSVEWSKDSACQCIQPCTFKAQSDQHKASYLMQNDSSGYIYKLFPESHSFHCFTNDDAPTN